MYKLFDSHPLTAAEIAELLERSGGAVSDTGRLVVVVVDSDSVKSCCLRIDPSESSSNAFVGD